MGNEELKMHIIGVLYSWNPGEQVNWHGYPAILKYFTDQGIETTEKRIRSAMAELLHEGIIYKASLYNQDTGKVCGCGLFLYEVEE